MDFQKDYYAVLEVNENATSVEIKKAYRTLAKKYHPDVNPGNLEYEEITKGLNEAYGVIGNQENKFIYDQYRNSLKDNPNLQKDSKRPDPGQKNKRSFVKKSIIITEKRIYVVGRIFIKYYASQDDDLTDNINDIFFNIHPTEVSARVDEREIYKTELPADVDLIFSTHQPSKFILTDVATEVVNEIQTNLYNLEIRNPIILNPTISDVTKHEGLSYGTLAGDFYALFSFKEEHELSETVYECFGETGRKEENIDKNAVYRRYEYYNSDCTTFWGPWIPEPIKHEEWTKSTANQQFNSNTNRFWQRYDYASGFKGMGAVGCGFIPQILFWGFLFWLLLALFNPLIWFLILLAVLVLWRNSPRFLRGVFMLGTFIFSLVALTALWSLFGANSIRVRSNVVDERREVSTVSSVGNGDSERRSAASDKNQIISHYRVWNDYSGNRYEGELKISLFDYQSAIDDHRAMENQIQSEADWALVYSNMLQNDRNRINRMYTLFDSIQNVRKLDQTQFAEMIVSCIQDIPYHIVLPTNCSLQEQEDPFVKNFLNENLGSCLGNISYGVQSPGEFLGNLMGDCDTRVAMLFGIFNHYKYKVAILGSSQFRHSVLGIQLPGEGLSKTLNGVDYKVWETTSEGFRPGILAPEVSDLSYWNFYLTN